MKRLQGQLARASKSEDFEDDTGEDEDDEDEDEGHTGEEEDGGVEGSLTAAGDDDDDDLIVVDEQREVVAFFANAKADFKKGAPNNVRIKAFLPHTEDKPFLLHTEGLHKYVSTQSPGYLLTLERPMTCTLRTLDTPTLRNAGSW